MMKRIALNSPEAASLLRNLSSSHAEDIGDAIIEIGKGGLEELEEEVARFLDHPDSDLRAAAIRVLGFYWKLDKYRAIAERMWRTDPDEDTRGVALMAWTGYYDGTNDSEVMRLLYGLLRDKNEIEDIRDAAYWSILAVAGLPGPEWPRGTVYGEIDTKVDWALVDRLMAEALKKTPRA